MTQEQQAPKKRIRIEVSTSTKGQHTYSATVEVTDDAYTADVVHTGLTEAVLAESDFLVAELDKRYPPPAA